MASSNVGGGVELHGKPRVPTHKTNMCHSSHINPHEANQSISAEQTHLTHKLTNLMDQIGQVPMTNNAKKKLA